MDQLRNLAEIWDLLRLVIETRKDQIAGIPWVIRPRKEPDEKNVDYKARAKEDQRAQTATQLFMRPDGEHLWQTWIRTLLEELFVIDALSLYPFKDRDGNRWIDILDGGTIKRLLDSQGRTPRPPDMAYQQIIKGMPAFGFRADQLFYRPRNQRAWKIYGYCFAPDTQILTKSGWRSVGDVTYHDELATRHPTTHAFEWQRPVALTSRPYDGSLIHFTGKGIDVLVTPEHNMIVQNSRTGREQLLAADTLAASPYSESHWRLPLAADSWEGTPIIARSFGKQAAAVARNVMIRQRRAAGQTYQEIAESLDITIPTVSDVLHGRYSYTPGTPGGTLGTDLTMNGAEFCAFMGMYLSEGSVNRGRVVVITQAQGSRVFGKFQRALRSACGGAVLYDGKDFHIHRTALAQYLTQFGHAHEKYVPPEIMDATPEQIRIFLDYLFDGDAHRNAAGQIFYYTTSQRLADQVQELAQKIGLPATVTLRPPRDSRMADGREIKAANCRMQYRVSVNRLKFTSPRATRVPFQGTVHCVSVPNHSVLVRRNGKATWTSQSPVEEITITVNLAIRRQLYKLNYYLQGNMPEAIVQMPDTWPPDRIKQFQEWWNAMLAGDLDRRRQFFFVPGFGGKDAISYPKQDIIKDEMDEWLARVVCYAFSVSPQPFIKEGMSRFGVQQQQQMAKAEGLIPTLSWVSEVLSDVMENGLGWKGLEFVFQEDTEPDLLKRAQIQEIRVRNGLSQIDEVREENGDEEIGVGAGIITASGFIPFPGQEGAQEIPGPGGGYDDGYGGAGDTGVVFATGRRGDNTSEGGPPEPKGNGGGPKNGGPKNGNPPRPATKRLHGAGGRHAFISPAQQARAARMEQLLSTFLSTQAAHAANRIVADYGRHAPARKFASEDVPLDSSEHPVQIVLHGDDAVRHEVEGAPLAKLGIDAFAAQAEAFSKAVMEGLKQLEPERAADREQLHLEIAAAVKAAVSDLPRPEATIVPDITVNVAPAAAAPVTVQPPAVNVTTPPMSIDAGAVQVTMPPVTIEKGAVQVSTPVSVAPAAVTVAAAPTPDVTVEASPAPPPAQVVIVNKQKRPKVKVKTSVQANLTPKATRKVVKRNALGEVESIDPVSDDEPPKR